MAFQRMAFAGALIGLLLPMTLWGQGVPVSDRPETGVAALIQLVDQSSETPIGSARVELRLVSDVEGGSWEGETDVDGFVVTAFLRTGEYEVRVEVLGYEPLVERVTLDQPGDVDLRVGLVPEAVALEPVVVAVRRRTRLELQGFYERREMGIGHFLDRSDIESRGLNRVADLFFSVPGARVIPPSLNQSASLVLLRNECVPLIVLDGSPISTPIRLDELLHPSDLEAVEVYHGPTAPVQFSPFTTCGTIMVWTRETRLLEGTPFSWRRLLSAGIVLGVLYFISR